MRKSKDNRNMHHGVNLNQHKSTAFWLKAFRGWNASDIGNGYYGKRKLDDNQRRAAIQLKLIADKTPRPSLR